jgi:hypothetical protein
MDQLRVLPAGTLNAEIRLIILQFMIINAMETFVDGIARAKKVRDRVF